MNRICSKVWKSCRPSKATTFPTSGTTLKYINFYVGPQGVGRGCLRQGCSAERVWCTTHRGASRWASWCVLCASWAQRAGGWVHPACLSRAPPHFLAKSHAALQPTRCNRSREVTVSPRDQLRYRAQLVTFWQHLFQDEELPTPGESPEVGIHPR